jgi:hypothetical protein
MGRFAALVALLPALGAPAPDGELVLGVAHSDRRDGAVTSEYVAAADPRTGETRARRLAGGALCHGPVLAVGGHAIFSGVRGRRAVARALPLTLTGAARAVGAADTFIPSSATGGLWLGHHRGRAGGGRLELRQTDLDGRVSVRASIQTGRWSALHADLGRFFVTTEGRWLTVWDRFLDTARQRMRDGWFVAAGRSRFAWCRGSCARLHVWSRRGGRTFAPPPGVKPLGPHGAFSPDGLRLATTVSIRNRERVAVVDLRDGRWTFVPGGALGAYRALAWSPSGRWLYFAGADEVVSAWRPGLSGATALPIRPGGTIMSIATAEPPG